MEHGENSVKEDKEICDSTPYQGRLDIVTGYEGMNVNLKEIQILLFLKCVVWLQV